MSRPAFSRFPERDDTRSQDAAGAVAPAEATAGETVEEVAEGNADTARPRAGPRRWALSVGVLGAIGAAIWYLESGQGIPFLDNPATGDAAQGADGIPAGTTGFVSFESQGIKLGASGGAAPKIGQPAPNFTLLDLDGKPVSLSDFRGSTVLMNFWATWCPPCRKEFPELVRVYRDNADRGLVVLGVDVQESPEIVRRFAAEFGATFPIVIDQKGDVSGQYRLRGLPTSLFIDDQGVLRAQHIGELKKENLDKQLGEAGFDTARRP